MNGTKNTVILLWKIIEVEEVWRSAKNFVKERETTGPLSSMEDGMIIKEINISPTVFYYADPASNRIGQGKIDYKYNKETGEEEPKIQLTNIIIDAIPHKILIYKNNPLLNHSRGKGKDNIPVKHRERI